MGQLQRTLVSVALFVAGSAASGCSLLMPRVKTEVDRTDVSNQHERSRVATIADPHVTITPGADGWRIVANPDLTCEADVLGNVKRARGVIEETPGWAYALPVADAAVGLAAMGAGAYFASLLAPAGDSVPPQAWSALVIAPIAGGVALGGLAGFQAWRATSPIEKVNHVDEGEQVVQRRAVGCEGVAHPRMRVAIGARAPLDASGMTFVLSPVQAQTAFGLNEAVEVVVTVSDGQMETTSRGRLTAADVPLLTAWQAGERERIAREKSEKDAAWAAERAARDAKQKADDEARYAVLVGSCTDVRTQFKTWCTDTDGAMSTDECDRSGRIFIERMKPATDKESAAMTDVGQRGDRATAEHKKLVKSLRPELWCAIQFQAKEYGSMYTLLANEAAARRAARQQRARQNAAEYFGSQKGSASSCRYGNADEALQGLAQEFVSCVQGIDSAGIDDSTMDCIRNATGNNERALCGERGAASSKAAVNACKRECLATAEACGVAKTLVPRECRPSF